MAKDQLFTFERRQMRVIVISMISIMILTMTYN